jgi:hypothetical protein
MEDSELFSVPLFRQKHMTLCVRCQEIFNIITKQYKREILSSEYERGEILLTKIKKAIARPGSFAVFHEGDFGAKGGPGRRHALYKESP